MTKTNNFWTLTIYFFNMQLKSAIMRSKVGGGQKLSEIIINEVKAKASALIAWRKYKSIKKILFINFLYRKKKDLRKITYICEQNGCLLQPECQISLSEVDGDLKNV